ncbi:MAG: hypothetical protein ACE5GS_15705 [Kiloniellaceae bacterium]
MPRDHPPLPDDGIYRTILWVTAGTVVAGAGLAIAGETVFQDAALSRLGAIVALVGGAVYGFFRWLGAREAKRRTAAGRSAGEDGGADA